MDMQGCCYGALKWGNKELKLFCFFFFGIFNIHPVYCFSRVEIMAQISIFPVSSRPLRHCRCEALQHPGQLSRGNQAVWLWRERPAHRLHGQLLCWNSLLHVGESAQRMPCRPHPLFLWPYPHFPSPSFSRIAGPALRATLPPPGLPSEPRAVPRKGRFGKERGTLCSLARFFDTWRVQQSVLLCFSFFFSFTHTTSRGSVTVDSISKYLFIFSHRS